jgi:hypothetical protein
MRRRFLCRLGRHAWHQQRTDDDQPYRGCRHCNAVDLTQDRWHPEGAVPPGAALQPPPL